MASEDREYIRNGNQWRQRIGNIPGTETNGAQQVPSADTTVAQHTPSRSYAPLGQVVDSEQKTPLKPSSHTHAAVCESHR
eukprot:5160820-Pyramimonas_sp.AAC.2